MIRLLRRKRSPLPFLILTLRRTGGTALTGALSRASPFPAAWHEPLDPARELGWITIAHARAPVTSDLHTSLRSALTARPNLKHCLETVPAPVTCALIDTCAELGYGMAVLTRRDERRRLRSLAVAQATGIWGPRQAKERGSGIVAGEVPPDPVDLDRLRDNALQDAAALGTALRVLRHRHLAFEWWIFEEIYETDRTPRDIVPTLARAFYLDLRADDPALDRLEMSQTGTRSIEAHVPGLSEADALLERLVTV